MNFKSLKFKILNSYVISSISITFVLLVLGFFTLLLLNIRDLSRSAKESVKMAVIINPAVNRADIDRLYSKLANEDFCYEISLVTPEEAMDQLKEDLGNDIDDVLDYNPLPYTININLSEAYVNTDSLQAIEAALKKANIVSDVFYNRSLVYQLDKNVRKLTLAVMVLEILLLLMAIALINNTIRLLLYSKRFEIKTMQLVGATRNFILKPFIVRAFWHGFISSMLVIALIILGILLYQNNTEDIVKIGHLEISFVVVLLAGVTLTTLATYRAVSIFLNSKTNDLYLL